MPLSFISSPPRYLHFSFLILLLLLASYLSISLPFPPLSSFLFRQEELENVMAVAPLESSSTPPGGTSPEPTRPSNDSMEDIDPQSTRKRPRLDSGSGACETLSTDKSSIPRMSEQSEPASAVPEQETSASQPPTNRVTINMKSPKSIDMSSETLDSSPDGAAPRTQSPEVDGNNASAAISVSSSPAQSPEIEVAEVEDMDHDPNASNWKSLGEALRDRANAEVVQLHDQYSLADTFPKFHDNLEQPGSLEQIALIIEKGNRLLALDSGDSQS